MLYNSIFLILISLLQASSFELSQQKETKLSQDHDIPGTIVGAQLRCEGYLCPSWALDVSRYDTIQYVNTTFEYNLQEVLPLAPTFQRSFHTYTAYDDKSREYITVATDYPVSGVDAFWVSTLNEYVNATTPVLSYVLVPHPGASPETGPNAVLSRILLAPNGRRIAIFRDGCIHDIDLVSQKYTKIGNLFDAAPSNLGPMDVTDAHVFDGYVLKSFVIKTNGEDSFLIRTDFSVSPITVSAPLAIQPLQGMLGKERPVAAYMIATDDGSAPRLAVLNSGNFDQLNWVDEKTGEQIYMYSNLFDAIQGELQCNEDLKDCDFWRTSAYDPVGHNLYIQIHILTGDVFDCGVVKIGWSKSKYNGEWYPYINVVHNFMNFGYSGYQYASIKQ